MVTICTKTVPLAVAVASGQRAVAIWCRGAKPRLSAQAFSFGAIAAAVLAMGCAMQQSEVRPSQPRRVSLCDDTNQRCWTPLAHAFSGPACFLFIVDVEMQAPHVARAELRVVRGEQPGACRCERAVLGLPSGFEAIPLRVDEWKIVPVGRFVRLAAFKAQPEASVLSSIRFETDDLYLAPALLKTDDAVCDIAGAKGDLGHVLIGPMEQRPCEVLHPRAPKLSQSIQCQDQALAVP
ncbi:MAG: hypothetical protein HYS27_16090 [Deltaproteobacteria bacterium]|nr:hypothetical protein [Deltaproteobacteria bacterium]